MQPLEGIRVLALEQAVAAPLCSRRLVLAGAEVLKVERPEGDFARYYDTAVAGQSAYFVWLNAGKKSVVLDLRESRDKEALLRLVGTCDILLQNLKPGALDALGVDLEQLRASCPSLITLSIAGFHPSGPGAGRKAYDLLMQAESGLAAITGSAAAPGRVGVSLVDIATGNFAYQALLEALLERRSSGRGKHIDVALFDSVAEWMAVPLLLQQHTGQAPQRVGLAHPGICPYGVFAASDGREFVLAVQNEREWQRLCAIDAELVVLQEDARCLDNPTRVTHRAFVDGALGNYFARHTYAVLCERLSQADLAFAPLSGVADLAVHPDLRVYSVHVDGQVIELPAVPGIGGLPGFEEANILSVPRLGEHTEEILGGLKD